MKKEAGPKCQIFISHFISRRQNAEFFFSKKFHQVKAGQNNKFDITKTNFSLLRQNSKKFQKNKIHLIF